MLMEIIVHNNCNKKLWSKEFVSIRHNQLQRGKYVDHA